MSMALAALGIDLMLPAFAVLRGEFGLPSDSTAVAGLVTSYFLGLAAGQVVYGPLADRFGRRPALFLGYAIYGASAVASALAPTLAMLLVARFVWGLGAAGPRVVGLAIIRDSFEGDRMSRAMSFVMAVFILVPVFAPALGALVITVVSWRWLFAGCALAAGLIALWTTRMPETLREENRVELRFTPIARAARFVISDRRTVGYTLAMTALYGCLAAYLGSAEIVFGTTFGRPEQFPLIFGGVAAVMGVSAVANATIVGRFGTRRLSHVVLIVYLVIAGLLVTITTLAGGRPPLGVFLVLLSALFAGHVLLIPNFNTIALAPMASVAGTASSVMGAVQISVGALLGAWLDQAFDGTVGPLTYGFFGYGAAAFLFVLWAEKGRLFQPMVDPEASVPAVAVDA